MLKAAAKRLPGVKFLEGDAATFESAGFDLVFANAVLQWIPDHVGVLTRLARALPPGGTIAAQMPDNLDEPSHRLMRAVAALPEFAGKAETRRERIGGFAEYDAALCPPCDVDLWRTTYAHRMPSPAAIVRWVEGTGLRPYLDPLDAEARTAFLAAYEEAVAEAYPAQPNGARLFAFPRLFMVATKSRG
jgi:trans-aconitate 2-methyltransferase